MTNVGSCNNCLTPTRFKRTWSERAKVQPDSSASAPTVNYGTAVLTIDVAANPHKPALQSLNCLKLTTCRTESTKDYQALSSSSPEASNSSLTLDPASKVSQSIRSYRKDIGLTTSESYSYSRVLSPLNEEEILTSGNPHLIKPQLSTTTISRHEIEKDNTVSREMLRQSTTYMPNRSSDRQVSAAVSRDGLDPKRNNTMNKTVNDTHELRSINAPDRAACSFSNCKVINNFSLFIGLSTVNALSLKNLSEIPDDWCRCSPSSFLKSL
ncbi:hypothetical protein GJ496_006701 [Pomphorhynchus laevis]|nr:hypothetical protein GJ496_006701 [Pomphorhynchus laevis]